jgi:hypothetical protein
VGTSRHFEKAPYCKKWGLIKKAKAAARGVVGAVVGDIENVVFFDKKA